MEKKSFPSKWTQADAAIIIANKIDFKPNLRRDWKRHFVLIKGKFHQDDISVPNIYGPNTMAHTLERKRY